MSKKLIKVGIGLGLLALGAAYLGKKTGLFEDDSHLYDEFESIQHPISLNHYGYTWKTLEESQ